MRFVVRNTDPIEHEFIVGDEATQQLHEVGTDTLHQGPGAVSVRSALKKHVGWPV